MFRLRLVSILLSLTGVFLLLLPQTVFAACCKCVTSQDPKTNICLTSQESDCSLMTTKTKNVNVKTLNCTALADAQCQALGKDNGICQIGPQDEAQYVSAAGTAAPASKSAEGTPVEGPTLNIGLPNLQFSSLAKGGGGYIQIPFFAQYIVAIQTWLIRISILAAAIVVVYGGFLYIVGSTTDNVSKGRKYIVNALIGLVIMMGAVTLLRTINPQLNELNAIKLQSIAADNKFLQENGTGFPVASDAAAERALKNYVMGKSFDVPVTTMEVNGEVIQTVNISSIPFDKELGGPANMKNYCTPQKDAAKATTYEEKIRLLVKAVLGWAKVCVQKNLCVYCQACNTEINSGTISKSAALPNYIIKQCLERNINECFPENLWLEPSNRMCIDAWFKQGEYEKNPLSGPTIVNGMPQCLGPAQEAYNKKFIETFQKEKLYAGDCGAFAMSLYSCAGAKFNDPPSEKAYDGATKKKVNTIYLSDKSLHTFDDDPGMIVSNYMNEDLLDIASNKGGVKFGDLVYKNCPNDKGAYSAHWFMYTGGRPDVPFAFIEMGGGSGVNVPGLGQLSGVHLKPSNWTIRDYINDNIKANDVLGSKGQVLLKGKQTCDPSKGFVYVWRPYADK